MQETFNTTLNGKDTVHRWSWASDLPLECATHSVGLRRYIDDALFSGRKEWSDWSPLKNVSGKLLFHGMFVSHGWDCLVSGEDVVAAFSSQTPIPLHEGHLGIFQAPLPRVFSSRKSEIGFRTLYF